MGMVIVGSKAFDLANVVLLELREPHGDDRHPYVVATLHNGQTIEVTSPLTPNDRTAQCVMSALVDLLSQGDLTGPRHIIDMTTATIHESEEGWIVVELDAGGRYPLIGMYGAFRKDVYVPTDLTAPILVGRPEMIDGRLYLQLEPEKVDS